MFNWKNNSENLNTSNKFYFWLGLSPLILSFSITIAILTILRLLPPKLPLFYSLPWGQGELVTHQQFLIIPASITLIALLNLSLSWQLHPSQSFFKKVLLVSSVTASLILTISFIKIVLNFF